MLLPLPVFFLATASLAAEITFFRDPGCTTSTGYYAYQKPGLKLTAFTNAFAPLPTADGLWDPPPFESGLGFWTASVVASACSGSSVTLSGRRLDCSLSDPVCVLTVPIGSCISHASAVQKNCSGGNSNSFWLKVTDATCTNASPAACAPAANFLVLLNGFPVTAVSGGSPTPSALASLSLAFSTAAQGICATCTARITSVTDMTDFGANAPSALSLGVAFTFTAPPGSAPLSAAVAAPAFSSALVSRLATAGFTSVSVGSMTALNPNTDAPLGPPAAIPRSPGTTPPWALLGLLALLLEPIGCCFCRGPTGNSESWRQRAARASPLLSAGFALLTLGLLAGAAAPVIPWLTTEASAPPITTTTLFERTYTVGNIVVRYTLPWYLAIGGALVYVGLVFLLVAWGMAIAVLLRVRAFARGGAAPPVDGCAATLPAVVGCAWAGLVVALGGAGWAWAWFWGSLYFAVPSGSSSPGSSLLAVAVASLFTASVLLAAASRVLVGLPGVGAARDCCCRVETRALAVGAALGARAPRRDAPRTGRRQSRRKSKTTAPVGLP